MSNGTCDFGLCGEAANQVVVVGGERRPSCEAHGALMVQTTTRPRRRLAAVTKLQRRDFAAAHAEGLHDEVPREFCPECELEGRRA